MSNETPVTKVKKTKKNWQTFREVALWVFIALAITNTASFFIGGYTQANTDKQINATVEARVQEQLKAVQ